MEKIRFFSENQLRSIWDGGRKLWHLGNIDIVGQLATNCSQLKLKAVDGKNHLTDVADTEHILRLIQSRTAKNAKKLK